MEVELYFNTFREEELEGWSARALIYNEATARATVQSVPALLSAVRIFPGANVIDAGCGPGYVAGAAAALGAECLGIDFSPAMVAAAKDRFPGVAFIEGDVEALPLEDESQDAVVSNIVLFHVTNPEKAVREAFRVLRPGGYFSFSQWCGLDEFKIYRLLLNVLSRHVDMSLASPAPNAFDLSDRAYTLRLMQRAGFSDITFTKVPNMLRAPGPSFYDFFMKFGVRIPLILEKQEPAIVAAVKAEIDELAIQYLIDGEFRVPMPSIVIAGRRL